jgi:hypothetical protein
METLYKDSPTGCCKKFDPSPWDEKEITFQDKLFLKDHIMSFFHVPLNFGQVMLRNMEKIQKAGALANEPLMLCDEKSLWGTDVFIVIDKEIPGANMTKVSGTFLTKVFEGSYKDMGEWISQIKDFCKSRGKEMKKLYFYYTTCPKCAKVYGKNYVVILAQV